MNKFVVILGIIVWILSMLSKTKRKEQLKQDRLKQLNDRSSRRQETEPRIVATPRSKEEILALLERKQVAQAPKTDYEVAYASDAYSDVVKTEVQPSAEVEGSGSHYRKNYGMGAGYALGSESAEEKEAYDKDIPAVQKFSLTGGAMKQYVVASEILGKPKALRRGRR